MGLPFQELGSPLHEGFNAGKRMQMLEQLRYGMEPPAERVES